MHTRKRLGRREGRDEETSEEGSILFVANVKLLDEWPGIWKDGCKGNWLCKANDGWNMLVEVLIAAPPSTTTTFKTPFT
jgi:hypothetical protein